MSVLIKGMEMPKCCRECDAEGHYDNSYGDEYGFFCPFGYKAYTSETRELKRLDNCPLVPVPPHGRLGDLDELERDFREDAKGPWNMRAMPMNWADAFEEVADIVADAPAIIEAEEATQKDGGQDETPAGLYDLLYEEGGYNSNGV